MKDNVLVLNKHYYPVMSCRVEKVFSNIFAGTVVPLDITYEVDENGEIMDKVQTFSPVYDVQEWLKLPVREYDQFILTTRGKVRIPAVVICSTYDKVIFKQLSGPTSDYIYKRDNYTCVYTGKILKKNELSIDHVIPVSRGGEDTWENMVTCDKHLNSRKSNYLPEECGLELLYKPYKPKRINSLDSSRKEWVPFLQGY